MQNARRPRTRSLSDILVFGPRNKREEKRKKAYERERDAFYAEYFSEIEKPLIRPAIDKALTHLFVDAYGYRRAIKTQRNSESRQLLARIAKKAIELVRSGQVRPKPNRTPADSGPRPSGSFCQSCGRYLITICYSQIFSPNRVPRTNKICQVCYCQLERSEKKLYHRYEYKNRPDPRPQGRPKDKYKD